MSILKLYFFIINQVSITVRSVYLGIVGLNHTNYYDSSTFFLLPNYILTLCVDSTYYLCIYFQLITCGFKLTFPWKISLHWKFKWGWAEINKLFLFMKRLSWNFQTRFRIEDKKHFVYDMFGRIIRKNHIFLEFFSLFSRSIRKICDYLLIRFLCLNKNKMCFRILRTPSITTRFIFFDFIAEKISKNL